jgi:hypothetical protein
MKRYILLLVMSLLILSASTAGRINSAAGSKKAMTTGVVGKKVYAKAKCAQRWGVWADTCCYTHSTLKDCVDYYPKGESCTEIDPEANEKARKGSTAQPAC